jgi:hypothetical protein
MTRKLWFSYVKSRDKRAGHQVIEHDYNITFLLYSIDNQIIFVCIVDTSEDIQYHGKDLHVSLIPNPSHLEVTWYPCVTHT